METKVAFQRNAKYLEPIIHRMYKTVADRLENCSKVILVHGNADMDAIGSAFALSEAFGDVTIYAPNGIDRVAKMVADSTVFLKHSCHTGSDAD